MVGIVKLENPIRHYDWGSLSAIAEFQGRPSPAPKPEAELWIGDHPTAPSSVRVEGGAQPLCDLREWIAADPEAVLGPEVAARYAGGLPFLVKLLAAASPLSIQVHPDARQAALGFAREERAGLPRERRSYPDAGPKREILIAVTPFYGLCSFRSDSDVRERVTRSASSRLQGLLDELPAGEPVASGLFLSLLAQDDETRTRVWQELAETGDAEAPREDPRFWLARLCEQYPRDPMVAAPLLLHLVTLSPGDCVVLDPGVVHSYLEGVGMEVMTCSDNVIRGGLTSKHVDREELARIMHRGAAPPNTGGPIPLGEGRWIYRTGAEAFAIEIQEVAGEARFRPEARSPRLLFCLAGQLALRGSGDTEISLSKGEVALVPASVEDYQARGDGRIFAVSHPAGRAEEATSDGK